MCGWSQGLEILPRQGSHAQGTNTPCHHGNRKKNVWRGFGEENVTGKLANEIANIECRNACTPGRIAHITVFLKSCESSIRDIDAIKVAMEMDISGGD